MIASRLRWQQDRKYGFAKLTIYIFELIDERNDFYTGYSGNIDLDPDDEPFLHPVVYRQ